MLRVDQPYLDASPRIHQGGPGQVGEDVLDGIPRRDAQRDQVEVSTGPHRGPSD
ncbi:hypothetical protein [Plantactinospora sp. KLBMP9567]|uniref:hypothetical protein n=1 Tax=Plantactinospora sp. KLBMP9567 TaxID=3085900 RepID=UPI0029823579|nr:hypothetical protein [Plantactinospora sp. KLBMP9567]MDW5326942.1 hypothetical protein [Plantactinospora sp. KLBMP9567]